MRIGSILACVATAPLLIAASPGPLHLTPSSAWVLDYAADSCRLSRTFGEGRDKVGLQFESSAPGELDMVAVGKPLDSGLTEIPAKFVPGTDKPFNGDPQTGTDKMPGVLWSWVPLVPASLIEREKQREKDENRPHGVRPPPIDLAERAEIRAQRQVFATAATSLEIGVRYNRSVILETGSLGPPIKAFDKCSRDSLRDWGVDPDVEDKIVRRPWGINPNAWFSSNDYPREMEQLSKVSEVRVRLLVDASGNATKCTSLTHFDEPKFNQVVCDGFMKRAKFEPAELADGTKVPSYYIKRVVFKLGY
jgi:hypothetical protein